jgi:diguanylate cyclase (GGDEF)-like protein
MEELSEFELLKTEIAKLKKENEELTNELKYYKIDWLTELPKRESFEKHIDKLFTDYLEHSKHFWTIMIDIDDLKKANDISREIGDTLIKTTSESVVKLFEDAKIFRYGGDEFILTILGKSNRKNIEERLEQIKNVTSSTVNTTELQNDSIADIINILHTNISLKKGKQGRYCVGKELCSEVQQWKKKYLD